MVFSSVVFLFYFLPLVLAVAFGFQFWINRSESSKIAIKFSNAWLLLASIAFYAWGEVGMLWVMLVSCLINYYGGKGAAPGKPLRRFWLILTVAANLGVLIWFKYSGMMADLGTRIHTLLGGSPGWHLSLPAVVLPLGISFYTFHGISYVIDVWRTKVKPTALCWISSATIPCFRNWSPVPSSAIPKCTSFSASVDILINAHAVLDAVEYA